MLQTNINQKTGIHYGVIYQNLVLQTWADESEPVYSDEVYDNNDHLDNIEDVDPIGWEYVKDGYKVISVGDCDLMVLESPFYTLTNLCSPCYLNAGNLESYREGGVKTYCLPWDWFDKETIHDGKMPYSIYYDVKTGLICAN